MDNNENMGKDYFSKNNRVITNDEQFTSDVQKYNNKMEEEELRLLSSLGLTEDDVIDKDDPDLGTTRSADAMLRSMKRQEEYKRKKIEEAKGLSSYQKKCSKSFSDTLEKKYRCEQVNATRADDLQLSNTLQKFQFLVGLNTTTRTACIKLEDHYYKSFPDVINKIFEIVTVIEKIKNKVNLEWDENGKICKILNLDEQQKEWEEFKKSSYFEDLEVVKSFKRNNIDAYNDIIRNGDKRFSVNNSSAIYEYQASIFFSLLFDKYLSRLDTDYIQSETRTYTSSLFAGKTFPLTLNYKMIEHTKDAVTYVIQGKAVLNQEEQDEIKSFYEKFYQPTIHYKYTEYNVEYYLKCTVDAETRLIKEGVLNINEAVKYNIENICQFKLRMLED